MGFFGKKDKKPIIFSPAYDIGITGMGYLHPFDMKKYSRVFNGLVQKGLIKNGEQMSPEKATPEDLALVHGKEYLESFESKQALAKIFEVSLVEKLPLFVTRKIILDPMLHQAGGSVLAAETALKTKWAINLGGGFHHASSDVGHGFCAIADITLAVKKLRLSNPDVKKIMIIDLDAHQGDGHESDFMKDKDTYIIDFYNKNQFPHDEAGRKRADINEGLDSYTKDEAYLEKLTAALEKAEKDFKADIILYVAGSDILEGDPLGALSVSAEGVIKRDEMVFDFAFRNNTPIAMLFGGGYQKSNASIIADSIENLDKKFGLLTKKSSPKI